MITIGVGRGIDGYNRIVLLLVEDEMRYWMLINQSYSLDRSRRRLYRRMQNNIETVSLGCQ